LRAGAGGKLGVVLYEKQWLATFLGPSFEALASEDLAGERDWGAMRGAARRKGVIDCMLGGWFWYNPGVEKRKELG